MKILIPGVVDANRARLYHGIAREKVHLGDHSRGVRQ